MKRILTVFFITAALMGGFGVRVWGQCPTGNITLTNQTQVNNWQTNYPGCTNMPYNLGINGGSINNLNGLSNLVSVSGSFSIQATFVQNLNGLQALTNVGGSFVIQGNSSLSSLAALSNLTSVGLQFRVVNNGNLTSLTGIENLSTFSNLSLQLNGNLSTCSLPNICTYLSTPSNTATITGNATNCASRPAVVAACPVLPVELMSFEGRETGHDCRLTWRTASEQDNSHFEVEHSRNGVSFAAIGRVEGNGTSTDIHAYEFLHRSLLPGPHYYRLRQMDFDGQSEYSPIISVETAGGGLHLSPNPAIGEASLYLDSDFFGEAILTWFDPMGRHVKSQALALEGNPLRTTLDLTELPGSGMYLVVVQAGQQRWQQRLVVGR